MPPEQHLVANIEHPVGDPVVGTGYWTRLSITGWENNLHTWSSDGMAFIRRVDDGATSSVNIFRKRGEATEWTATDRLCGADTLTETVAIDGQALGAQNGSGISATVTVGVTAYATSQMYSKIIISFCDETDLNMIIPRLSTCLDSDSKFQGQTRFRAPLMMSLRWVWDRLANVLRGHEIRTTSDNIIELASITAPGILREIQAKYAAGLISRVFGYPSGTMYMAQADKLMTEAEEDISNLVISLDTDYDGDLDMELPERTTPKSNQRPDEQVIFRTGQ